MAGPRAGLFPLLLLPCLILLATTLPHLNQGDFRRDTGRYAAVGLYMWDGGSLARPYLNPETPYFNKPPLALWVHGLFLKLFGREVAVARIPSVLAALGVVCLSVLIALRIGSRSEAVVGGMVLALTYDFFRRTREISLDFWQLLFVLWAVYLVVAGAKSDRKTLVVGAGLPLGLALLCKPLVALTFLPVLLVWLILFRKTALSSWLLLGAVPLAVLVALPWHWHMYSFFGEPFVSEYFFHQVVDRAAGRIQTESAGFYVRSILGGYWPWLLAVLFALWHRYKTRNQARKPGRDLVFLGSIWTLFLLGVLTAFPDKKPNYALPLYPGLSWLAAAGLCRVPWRRLRGWYAAGFPWLRPAAVALLLILSLAPIQFQKPPDQDWLKLAEWLRTRGIGPGDLAQAGLEPNELCLFYLRTGWWVAPFVREAGSASRQLPALLLIRAEDSLVDAYPAAFQPGKLAVLSLAKN